MSATVAITCARPQSQTGQADARLIAAAPELFDALYSARHQLVAVTGLVTKTEHCLALNRAIERADHALAKVGK